MNWGMSMSPYRTVLSGELLDQTDRAEMQALQSMIDRRLREQELARLENDIGDREGESFMRILADLSGNAPQVLQDEAMVAGQMAAVTAMSEPYLREVATLIKDVREN